MVFYYSRIQFIRWYVILHLIIRYRPKTLDEVEGNEDSIYKLKKIAEEGNLPNMILAGPPVLLRNIILHI